MPLTIQMDSENIRETIRVLSKYDARVAPEVIANKEKMVSRSHSTYYLLSAMYRIVGRSRPEIE